MKKWLLLVPAIASLAAGTYVLIKKDKQEPAAASEKKDVKKNAPANSRQGSYSFVSGFHDAKTVELTFTYDADRFSFKEIEDDFLTFTSVSHAVAIYGEDFNIQIEYFDYSGGEDFDALGESLREKKKGFGHVVYGRNTGYMYYNGDNVCFVFPATEYSYLLVTVIKAKNSDIDFRELPENDDVAAILESFEVK